jgi:hypothetical protein
MQMRQKANIEQELQNRLSFLSGKGIEAPKIKKDPIVRKLQADVRALNNRLRLVADSEKRTEEMAKIKAERAAAPKKEEEGGKVEKSKKASQEGKKERGKRKQPLRKPRKAAKAKKRRKPPLNRQSLRLRRTF